MAIEAEFYRESDIVGSGDNIIYGLQDHQVQAALGFDQTYQQNQVLDSFPIGAYFDAQSQQLDSILHLQNERLKSVLEAKRKEQIATVLAAVGSKARILLKQKEEELGKAKTKAMELETQLRNAEIESETWRRVAAEKETTVIQMSNMIEQVTQRDKEAAESFCYVPTSPDEENQKLACKNCNAGRCCVVLLPCRHLCCCKECESLISFCPVCMSLKEATIEVFWV